MKDRTAAEADILASAAGAYTRCAEKRVYGIPYVF